MFFYNAYFITHIYIYIGVVLSGAIHRNGAPNHFNFS